MSNYIARLKRFTTCDISDGLLNLYGISNGGYFPNLLRRSGSGTVVGRAFPVLFGHTEATKGQASINYIDNVPAESIVTIGMTEDLQLSHAPYTKPIQAMYGGLMSTRAKYLGSNGTVVFGRIRDVEEHQNLDHTVFSYGIGTCAPKAILKPIEYDCQLKIKLSDGTTEIISPGDYLVCDDHGMVRIPTDSVDLEKLVIYIEKSIEADDLVSQDIKAGKPASESQKDRRAILKQYL
ncbi:unnamed protein product [Kluyveromyces dobzhanskii CBS 2104]|uniref:WGS project CCBQ000000000 data, contig 00102 n=1 Tax=Kluyveromyces dobzhanskii CBS 2104 TaxID=1427455 RepID=A0A0A8L6P6_9SACH|nr:unnamed protein product [Kluyveromyces dobzhanskii CBS 2104]